MSVKRTFRIVVGLDLTEMSHVVLETAFDIAARHEHCELHLISVFAPPRGRRKNDPFDGELDRRQKEMEDLVVEKVDDFSGGSDGDKPSFNILIHTRVGKPADEIVDLAWECQAEQIIIGRHSGAEKRFARLGSVPAQILQLTRCPVLVVQPTDYGVSEDLDEQRARQCPACVETRSESQGERWFCVEHSDYKLSRRVYMAHHSATWPIGGGPLL